MSPRRAVGSDGIRIEQHRLTPGRGALIDRLLNGITVTKTRLRARSTTADLNA
jgi:hypothetical protein